MKQILFLSKISIFFVLFYAFDTFTNEKVYWPTIDKTHEAAPFINQHSKWVDSVFQSLTLEEKIAQLFMIPAYSNKTPEFEEQVARLIKKHKVGGVIFFQGGPSRQARLTNYYQNISQTPLLVAIDGEWGLSMRLDSTVKYPRQMMLGAIQNQQYIYDMGAEFARQFKRIGVHINFAPVIDVNNNAKNPVINNRSFGERPMNVASKGLAYMHGLQDNRIIATAKHFPGHGDTDTDSHKTLPIIRHNRSRLDSIEIEPFKRLIDGGLAAIMVAHLNIPALDSTPNIASSISPKIVSDLLKKELNFKGLVFTDALGMKGVSANKNSSAVDIEALKAGADILLMSKSVSEGIKAIKNAIEAGEISIERINESCKKILLAKYWVGLSNYKPIDLKNIARDLNNSTAKLVNQKLIEGSLSLLKNENELVPIKNLDTLNIASISIGYGAKTKFQKTLSLYTKVKHFSINKNASTTQFQALNNQLTGYDLIIVSYHTNSQRPPSFGANSKAINFITNLANKKSVILDIFANPYILSFFDTKKIKSVVMSYQNTKLTQDFSAQLLFGGIAANGLLPVSAGDFPVYSGYFDKSIRIKYATPKEVDMNELELKRIDSIAISAIDKHATPGCQILAMKNGIVFYHKAFGYHTYKKEVPVQTTDLYDLASITKIAATLPSIIKLTDQKKIDLRKKLSFYLPELDSTNKKNLFIKDILTHQARLQSWIPFYIKTFNNNYPYKLDTAIYNSSKTSHFSLKVANNIYMNNSYVDSMYQKIYDTKLRSRKRYRYSDLGFLLFMKMIEKISKQPLDEYTKQNFYASLGATTLGYNPLEAFSSNRIVPTENDLKFRKQLLQGYVHDYGAAMMGGVGGHAGLFSNANDLAKLMQMYLQKGSYGGKKYFNSNLFSYFTSCHYCSSGNRRGLGFDRPAPTPTRAIAAQASKNSFGHTGFTGTIAWVDPNYDLVFIFLSNRIHPNAENRKLIKMNVRSKIQSVLYKAMKSS